MYTLFILLILLSIKCYFNIKKNCRDNEFNLFEGGFLNYVGFLTGGAILICNFIYFCVKYLP